MSAAKLRFVFVTTKFFQAKKCHKISFSISTILCENMHQPIKMVNINVKIENNIPVTIPQVNRFRNTSSIIS